MWRSRARSLLSRLPPQRTLLSLSQVPNPQTLVPPPLPGRARCGFLPRFLSADSDVGSSIPDRTTSHLTRNGEFDGAKGETPSLSQDPTLNLEKGGAFAEGDDGSLNLDDFRVESDDFRGKGVAFGEADDGNSLYEDVRDDSSEFVDKEGAFAGGDDGNLGCDHVRKDLDEFDGEKFEEVMSVLRIVEAESVDPWLEGVDFALGKEFATRMLHDPDVPLHNLIRFFAWAFKRPDFAKSSLVVGLLVEKVTGSPEIDVGRGLMLWDLVREVGEGEKGLLSTEALNHLIAMFSKLGKGRSVVEVYKKFNEMECVPDGETYYLTIHALGKPSWATTAWHVCKEMVSSKRFPDDDKVGKIVKFFCKGGKVKDAHVVYLAAKESSILLPPLYLDILIDYLSRRDDTLDLAMELLEEYTGRLEKPSVKPFACVISGLCRVKDAGKAKGLLQKMLSSGPTPVRAVFNDVITALSKSGDVEDAVALLRAMKSKGLKPDIRAYNVVMSAFSKAGLMKEARDVLSQAKRVHRKLGRVSFHILSRGYCRIDDFESAIKCMNEMKEEGILPNVDDYRKMIQSLCLKALDWRTAQELLEEMKSNGLCLDGQTRGLIAAVKELEAEEIESLREPAEA